MGATGYAEARPTVRVGHGIQLRAAPSKKRSRKAGLGLAGATLTSRGRLLAGTLAVAALLAVAAILGLRSGGPAQAAGHGPLHSGYQSMRQVVVRPGQTLWGIATAAEPAADPFQVMQQIMEANTLSDTAIRAGQVLWVPRR